jgi:hypothetical protein
MMHPAEINALLDALMARLGPELHKLKCMPCPEDQRRLLKKINRVQVPPAAAGVPGKAEIIVDGPAYGILETAPAGAVQVLAGRDNVTAEMTGANAGNLTMRNGLDLVFPKAGKYTILYYGTVRTLDIEIVEAPLSPASSIARLYGLKTMTTAQQTLAGAAAVTIRAANARRRFFAVTNYTQASPLGALNDYTAFIAFDNTAVVNTDWPLLPVAQSTTSQSNIFAEAPAFIMSELGPWPLFLGDISAIRGGAFPLDLRMVEGT